MPSVYLRGNPISIINRFRSVDPLTQEGTPENPDVVTFYVLGPDEFETPDEYVFGIAPEVTNPAVGVFLLSLNPQLPVGAYKWRCASSGSGLIQAEEGAFDVIESGVLPPDPPKVAVDGPCSAWISGDDVANNGPPIDGIGSDTWKLDDVAYDASSLLYALSGRQYPGVCERVVRPCQSGCGCWSNLLWPASPGVAGWWWGGSSGVGGWGVGPWWVDDYAGLQCGCGGGSQVNLDGYPVREILEVKINGVVLPPTYDDGSPRYRLDDRRYLTRMWEPNADDPANPTQHWWPNCQNLSLDDDQPSTFSVKYSWGADAPSLGRAAAVQLARELWSAMATGKCALSAKATKIVRQGITVERITPLAQLLRQGATGLTLVDAFIAQVNPIGMIRRPMVYSPDMQQFARKVGQ